MKKCFILLLVILTHSIYSQDNIDPSSYLSAIQDEFGVLNFNAERFIKGWNWSSFITPPQNHSFDSQNEGLISEAGKAIDGL